MTLTTIQSLQQNHRRIMDVLGKIEDLTAAGIHYNIMDSNKEPFIMIRVKDHLSEQDTKTIYDNAMTIQSISRLNAMNIHEESFNIKLSYPFTNPFTYSQTYESRYLFIEDGGSRDLVLLKYAEVRMDGTIAANRGEMYKVNFIVVNLSNGSQEQIWSVDPSFQEEVLGAIQKYGPKLNVRREGREPDKTRYYFEQIPLEHARPDEVV
jgi:hypothetical protein